MSLVLPRHLMCKEIVELVTAYIEGDLSEADAVRFEGHLVSCNACVVYVEQMRQTIRAVGGVGAARAVTEIAINPEAERSLMEAFALFRAKEG